MCLGYSLLQLPGFLQNVAYSLVNIFPDVCKKYGKTFGKKKISSRAVESTQVLAKFGGNKCQSNTVSTRHQSEERIDTLALDVKNLAESVKIIQGNTSNLEEKLDKLICHSHDLK